MSERLKFILENNVSTSMKIPIEKHCEPQWKQKYDQHAPFYSWHTQIFRPKNNQNTTTG